MTIEQLNTDFESFRDQLTSYIYRIIGHRETSEDLVQDTYIKASAKIDQFKGDSALKTWVFAIATNLCRDHQRAQQRWGEDWMDLVRDRHVGSPELMQRKQEIVSDSPHGKFVLSEHLNYCFTCTSKTLPLIQQICLLLKEVYGFKVSEIMLITELSEGKVKHALADSRKDMGRIFEHKCALINKNGTCSQCTGLNGMYNPMQDAQAKANELKLVRESNSATREKLLDLRFEIVRSLDPLKEEGRDLHNYLLENSPCWVEQQKSFKKEKRN